MLVQLGEALFDMLGLRPDTAVDHGLFVVGNVHESRKVLAEADGIDDRAGDLARRERRKEPEDDIVEPSDKCSAAAFFRFEKDGALLGKGEAKRHGNMRSARQRKLRRQCACERFEVHFKAAKAGEWCEFPGRLPIVHILRCPRGEVLCDRRTDGLDFAKERLDCFVPIGKERVPLTFVLKRHRGIFRGVGLGQGGASGDGVGVDFGDSRVAHSFDCGEARLHEALVFLQCARELFLQLRLAFFLEARLQCTCLVPLGFDHRLCGRVRVSDSLAFGVVMRRRGCGRCVVGLGSLKELGADGFRTFSSLFFPRRMGRDHRD